MKARLVRQTQRKMATTYEYGVYVIYRHKQSVIVAALVSLQHQGPVVRRVDTFI